MVKEDDGFPASFPPGGGALFIKGMATREAPKKGCTSVFRSTTPRGAGFQPIQQCSAEYYGVIPSDFDKTSVGGQRVSSVSASFRSTVLRDPYQINRRLHQQQRNFEEVGGIAETSIYPKKSDFEKTQRQACGSASFRSTTLRRPYANNAHINVDLVYDVETAGTWAKSDQNLPSASFRSVTPRDPFNTRRNRNNHTGDISGLNSLAKVNSAMHAEPKASSSASFRSTTPRFGYFRDARKMHDVIYDNVDSHTIGAKLQQVRERQRGSASFVSTTPRNPYPNAKKSVEIGSVYSSDPNAEIPFSRLKGTPSRAAFRSATGHEEYHSKIINKNQADYYVTYECS